MLNARSIIPPRGNPAREPFIVCLVGFTAMAILFNVVIPLMGVSTEGDLFFNLALISIAAIFLWLIRNHGQHAEKDRARLVAGERWAHWQLSPFEYKLYARRENNRARGVAAAFLLVGIVGGVVTYAITGELIRGVALGGACLVAARVTLTQDHAPRSSAKDQTLEVFVGPRGALIGSRYLTFTGPGMSLLSIDLEYEEWALPLLVFHLRGGAGRRTVDDHVRIPVPVDRIDEARAIVQRFNDGTLPKRSSPDNRLQSAQVAIR